MGLAALDRGRSGDLPVQAWNDPHSRWMLYRWNNPVPLRSSWVSRNFARFAAAIGVVACIACGAARLAADDLATTKVDFAKSSIGMSPDGFEFARTAEGDLGRWTWVRDPTAAEGVAIQPLR